MNCLEWFHSMHHTTGILSILTLLFFFQRESGSGSGGSLEGKGKRESQAESMPNAEPDAGLGLNLEIVMWAKIKSRCSTDQATQVLLPISLFTILLSLQTFLPEYFLLPEINVYKFLYWNSVVIKLTFYLKHLFLENLFISLLFFNDYLVVGWQIFFPEKADNIPCLLGFLLRSLLFYSFIDNLSFSILPVL